MNKTIIQVLSKILKTNIISADYKTTQLRGGTVGDVQLVTGECITGDGRILPYKIVSKSQKKWERIGDPDSWRREYDLYNSNFGTLFSDTFRMPVCCHAEINEEENEWQVWMEYIDGVSGLDLTSDMYELAAEKLGQFQGKIYAEQPSILKNLTNLSKVEYAKNFYLHYRSWEEVYDYIRSDDCEIPDHLCKMLIDIDEYEADVWKRIESLPIVLCHRDFWITNIFMCENLKTSDEKRESDFSSSICTASGGVGSEKQIILIDWDTTGWGYLGEDIASLIADETDPRHMVEYYLRCVSAYYRGFSEYVDVSHITNNCIYELILVMFGYRLVEWYKFAKSPDEKMLHFNTLQKIYEIGECASKPITKDFAIQLLKELGDELEKEGIYATIDIYGGVAMMLTFMPHYSSDDVDAKFINIAHDKFRQIKKRISMRHAQLKENWIDEGVWDIIRDTMKKEDLVNYKGFGGLNVRFPTAEQLLAMKLFAARIREDKNDLNHAIILCRELNIKGRPQLESILKKYFKEDAIREKNRSRGSHNATHKFIEHLMRELQYESV